jgi:capsular polysaccharide biosynthesis protein
MPRPAIEVAELRDAELIICNDNAVVLSADDALQENLSVAGFPELVLRKVRRMAAETVEQLSLDEAVLILDMFPVPNLCHFLLDQATRLELYRRAGVDLTTATVIGPELRTDFQRTILRRLGVRNSLGTACTAIVRVRRLWVSSNCLHLTHAADLGAGWAISYLRNALRPAPAGKPRRLFVSRADAASRRCANEEEVRSLLAPLGFETIVPGPMPYEEQISAFQDATHVVACHGAALANTVLCSPGAHVLEIFHALYGTPAYAMLAHEGGLDYAAMMARDAHSEAPQFNDPATLEGHTARFGLRDVRVDTGELRRWLESVT